LLFFLYGLVRHDDRSFLAKSVSIMGDQATACHGEKPPSSCTIPAGILSSSPATRRAAVSASSFVKADFTGPYPTRATARLGLRSRPWLRQLRGKQLADPRKVDQRRPEDPLGAFVDLIMHRPLGFRHRPHPSDEDLLTVRPIAVPSGLGGDFAVNALGGGHAPEP
jgi:hypothetical protein